jgi:hypothetical protein
MSIQVLKKKSERYNPHYNISGIGSSGFSLVGGHRNIGCVGQTNLAKSVSRTRFRGVAPMGHGGQNGKFKIVVANSGSFSGNDSSIIKTTVKSNAGSILKQNRWLHSKYPHFWVKNDASLTDNFTQGSYIKNLSYKVSKSVITKPDSGIYNCGDKECRSYSYYIGCRKIVKPLYSKDLNRYPVSSSEYQKIQLLKNKNLPTPDCLAPFPFSLNNDCNIKTYLTPQDAIDGGLLPSDWMNCNPTTNPNCDLFGTDQVALRVSRTC